MMRKKVRGSLKYRKKSNSVNVMDDKRKGKLNIVKDDIVLEVTQDRSTDKRKCQN